MATPFPAFCGAFTSTALAVLAACSASLADRPPRVAVWDPEVGTDANRCALDPAYLDRVSEGLRAAGCEVTRPTTAQLEDTAAFAPDRTDAFLLQGLEFPRSAIPALRRFHDGGGVLVALGAKVPFLIAIERRGNDKWTLSPPTPNFAWQDGTLLAQVGARYIYDPARHDQGWNHAATGLLKRYLPGAPDIPATRLQGWWIIPWPQGGAEPAEVFPLVRSQRADGRDVPPQLMVVRRGKRHAILGLDPRYTDASDPGRWPLGKETVVALARLAQDLRTGDLVLDTSMRVEIPEDLPPMEALRTRMPTGSVDPEDAAPWRRWGRFDGASHELGAPVAAGAVAVLPSEGGAMPRRLEPGAALRWRLPADAPAPLFLRVRGAFEKTGAALRVLVDDIPQWNERLNAVDASGKGNWGVQDIGNAATEFHRVVFLPGAAAGSALELSNPGSEPVFFDALQLESRSAGRPRLSSLNYGYHGGWPESLPTPPPVTRGWPHFRVSAMTESVGAPDMPGAFARSESEIERALAVVPSIDLLLQGTPEWAAISAERYAQGKARGRPHCTAPDPEKYAVIVRHLVAKYRDRIDRYEIWNEAESNHFYYGSHAEYIAFFLRISSLIRELDPGAEVVTTGMAGFHEGFVSAMHAAGAYDRADLIAFHPYAGQSPGWDVVYGLMEGSLYAKGIGTEVYCNESGFPYINIEWFTNGMSPYRQLRMLDIAVARLLANGVDQLSIFHAGGDDHVFSLVDSQGAPRPAYAVYADYLALGTNGARRVDVAMSAADGGWLQGVYTSASRHADGSVTAVLNPAEIDRLQPPEPGFDPSMDFTSGASGHAFYGTATVSNGCIRLTPGPDRPYVGYQLTATVDLGRQPLLEVAVPACANTWSLAVKADADTHDTLLFDRQPAGTVRVDLREKLGRREGRVNLAFTFRIPGMAEIDHLRFLTSGGRPVAELPSPARPAVDPLPVVLRTPFPGAGDVRAYARTDGVWATLPASLHGSGAGSWAEVTVLLAGRTLIRLVREPPPR